ncbi:hypothetical protein QGN29_07040 [Temperatibacter marinus]|uniref:Uncharacterized protein n=1 Tax=Temperatibacter marinus TaxID=1456591 RepID=A0AA52EG26_9PROT|nr:hypothetical protein [Temperatibacter marinus]WND04126.1 hypothetical protein QGN29_07040 [Temperatibacter marinus]
MEQDSVTGALIAIIIVTLTAPLLAKLTKKFGYLRAGLDGFVLMSVIGLVILVLVPDALFHKGKWALVVLLVGFFLPAVAEYFGHKYARYFKGDCHAAQRKTHKIVLLISAFAIIFHALTDGAILALAKSDHATPFLSLGVVAHRVGVAITLWWLLEPYISSRSSYLMLILFALVTYLGFSMAGSVSAVVEAGLGGYWQAFAAGSLLHVVMHPLRERNIPLKTIQNAHRLGTCIAFFFLIASIFSALELTTNHMLSHQVLDPSNTAVTHAGMEESLYILKQAGLIVAPWLLAFIVGLALFRVRSKWSLKNFVSASARVAPMTFLIWLISAAFYALMGTQMVEDHPLGIGIKHVEIFYLWLLLVFSALLYQGAPKFFTSVMPDFLSHDHSH